MDVSLQDPVAVLNYFFYDQAGLNYFDTDNSLAAYLAMTWTTSSTYDPEATSNTLVYTSGTSTFTVKYSRVNNQTDGDQGSSSKGSEAESIDFNGANGETLDFAFKETWDEKDTHTESQSGWASTYLNKGTENVKATYKEANGITISMAAADQDTYSNKWISDVGTAKGSASYSDNFKYSDAAGYKLNLTVTSKESESDSMSYSTETGSDSQEGTETVTTNLNLSYADASKNSFKLTGKVSEVSNEVNWEDASSTSTLNAQTMSFATADYSIASRAFTAQGVDLDVLLGGIQVTNITNLFSASSLLLTTLILMGDNTIKVTNTLTGQDVKGGAGKDMLTGNAASDRLAGESGADTLSGGKGADIFVFNTALGSTNVDTIKDFKLADGDKIELSSSIFTAIEFGVNLVYQSSNGKLSYDADGAGDDAAIHFATLVGKPALTAENFSDVFSIV